MNFVSPLYIVPRRPWSFSAFLSCSPMHLRYAFLNEKALIPNSLCGSCLVKLDVLLGTLQIVFVTNIYCLSNFLILINEYSAAWKLYATSSLKMVFTIFIFFVLVLLVTLLVVPLLC
jgi:hypothetical protein